MRSTTQHILARSEFNASHHHWWDTVIYYLLHPIDAIEYAIGHVLSLFLDHVAGSWLGWTVAGIGLVVIGTLLVRYGRSTSSDTGVAVVELVKPKRVGFKGLMADADRFESEQRWRDAIRARYGATVAFLADQGLVRREPGRTTGEYLTDVTEAAPNAAPAFGRATLLFEWVWYGNRQAGEGDASELRRLVNDVRRGAEQ